jgi:hypothetical protein
MTAALTYSGLQNEDKIESRERGASQNKCLNGTWILSIFFEIYQIHKIPYNALNSRGATCKNFQHMKLCEEIVGKKDKSCLYRTSYRV